MSISPELLAKINALPYEDLKADILDTINDPGIKRAQARARITGRDSATDEELFENMVRTYLEVKAQRETREILMYRWRDDEVLAFIEHFKRVEPQKYADYLHQERNGRQIDADLSWDMRLLGKQWHPGLAMDDYRDLYSKVRDYAQVHLI
ncbi:MAG TPA: hypothetical protein VF798_10940 [Burkholderiaceae bacterium]